MTLAWPDKDPQEILDYKIDWDLMLAVGETIVTSTWSSPTNGPTLSNAQILTGNRSTLIWAAGGTEGATYNIENTITTSAGRTIQRSVALRVATL